MWFFALFFPHLCVMLLCAGALFSGDGAAIFGAVVVFALWFWKAVPLYAEWTVAAYQEWRKDRAFNKMLDEDYKAALAAAPPSKFRR